MTLWIIVERICEKQHIRKTLPIEEGGPIIPVAIEEYGDTAKSGRHKLFVRESPFIVVLFLRQKKPRASMMLRPGNIMVNLLT